LIPREGLRYVQDDEEFGFNLHLPFEAVHVLMLELPLAIAQKQKSPRSSGGF
jgi:hypothetical protein